MAAKPLTKSQTAAAVAEANGLTKKQATDLLTNLADLAISLHPVSDGALDGPVLGATATLPSVAGNAVINFNEGADFDAGGYFLAVIRTHYEGQSSRIRFCAGRPEEVSRCQVEEDTTQAPAQDPTTPTNEEADAPLLGCHASPADLSLWGLALLLLGRRQKKRRPEGRPFFNH